MKLPQFTLRDLFWLVLVSAMAVGWWADRLSLVKTEVKLLNEIERLEPGHSRTLLP
jgi:hypothetical protein